MPVPASAAHLTRAQIDALGAELDARRLEVVLLAAGDGHLRPVAPADPGDLLADARGPAGDEDHLAGQRVG